MKALEDAARAYVVGDAGPVLNITARSGLATFFPPMGGFQVGAEAIRWRYERDAANFAPGAQNQLEILHMAAGEDIAYWVGFQRATVHMRDGSRVPFNLRIIEIFRREGGEWKMVHRHADTLAAEPQEQKG